MIAKKLFHQLKKSRLNYNPIAGFSLTEKIATIIIAGIASTALLSGVVELSQIDRRETVLTQTQQEMQLALQYLSDDLRESVYVYDDDRILPNLPDFGPNTKLILAFWKAEPISQTDLSGLNCASFFFTTEKQRECRLIKTKRFNYSLIVYLQEYIEPTDPEPDPYWGKSRILRYRLPAYKSGEVMMLNQSTGYVDPGKFNNFNTWPVDGLGIDQQGGILPDLTESEPQILVEFVDDPASSGVAHLPTCGTEYNRIPDNPTDYNSFFACVRKEEGELGRNQDIILYLRGNAEKKNGIKDVQFLPTLETSVTLRGIIDKFDS